MDEAERLSNIIGGIYDAALDPALWPVALRQASGFVNGSCSTLFAKDAAKASTPIPAEARTSNPKILVDPLADIHATGGATALVLSSGPWTMTVNGTVRSDGGDAIYLSDTGASSSRSLSISGPCSRGLNGRQWPRPGTREVSHDQAFPQRNRLRRPNR